MKSRVHSLDLLKGIAILAVVLYHVDGKLFSFGYLGVDVFLVVSGYLTIPKIISKLEDGSFSYVSFIKGKIKRFSPLLLCVCIVTLLLSLLLMIPDAISETAESIIATICYANNLLSLYLYGSYWEPTNDFKPLMHTWYLGIIMELFVVIPLILMLINYIVSKVRAKSVAEMRRKLLVISVVIISLLSLTIFCFEKNAGVNFYLFLYRIFEFGIGGIVGLLLENILIKQGERISTKYIMCGLFSLILLVVMLFAGQLFMPSNSKMNLVLVVVLSSMVILFLGKIDLKFLKPIEWIGKASFSIFLWHQVVLAFYRYSISIVMDYYFWIIYVPTLFALSVGSYYVFEKKKNKWIQNGIVQIIVGGCIGVVALIVWIRGGLFYDVPELDLYANEKVVHRKHQLYCDRIYDYDRQFSDDGLIKVFAIGISYTRDWSNVLLESEMSGKIDLVYSYGMPEKDDSRLKKCDIVFIYADKNEIPDYFWETMGDKPVYSIGVKKLGQSIGQNYIHRNDPGYFNQTVELSANIVEENKKRKEQWGEYYIDLLSYIINDDGTIDVFTDDNKYISYDTVHLSEGGAKYFARIIDVRSFFDKVVNN